VLDEKKVRQGKMTNSGKSERLTFLFHLEDIRHNSFDQQHFLDLLKV
jgi:hypothetical protein